MKSLHGLFIPCLKTSASHYLGEKLNKSQTTCLDSKSGITVNSTSHAIFEPSMPLITVSIPHVNITTIHSIVFLLDIPPFRNDHITNDAADTAIIANRVVLLEK